MSSAPVEMGPWRLVVLPLMSALYAGSCVNPDGQRAQHMPQWELDVRMALCALCLSTSTSLVLMVVGVIKSEKR